MRVLLVANGFPPLANAGVESHTYTLALELQRAGHEVHVFCRDADSSAPMYEMRQGAVDGVPVTRVVNNLLDIHSFEGGYRNARIDGICARLLATFQPDVVHIQHLLGLSVGCLEQAAAAGIPTIVSLHDYWYICPTVNLIRPDLSLCAGAHNGMNCFDCVALVPAGAVHVMRVPFYERLHRVVPPDVRQKVFRWLQRLQRRQQATVALQPTIDRRVDEMRTLLESADVITTPSQHLKNKYVGYGVDAQNIRVVPLGMDLTRWQQVTRPERPEGAPLRFGYAGSVVPIKGLDVAVRAFTQVPGNMTLDVAGFEPPGNTYTAHVRTLMERDPRIKYLGSIPSQVTPALFASWDALLVPTLSEETFSFVTREALLAGTPVMASDRPVLPEIVRHGVNGFLVNPGDVEAWAAQFRALLAEPARLREIDTRTDRSFARSFTEHAAEQIQMYAEVCAAKEERGKAEIPTA